MGFGPACKVIAKVVYYSCIRNASQLQDKSELTACRKGDPPLYWEILLKLLLAMLFGGIIGLEREFGNRPAGFRTHTLVCMGSVLVMLTAQYVFQVHGDSADVDLTRLGAQVISGIGFLGAGTILKDGSRVRGLTTAASLWVVACIGLAVGVGFYWGALVTSVLSYVTLVLLKRIEGHLIKEPRRFDIQLEIPNVPGQVAAVTQVMARLDVHVRDIRVETGEAERVKASFSVILPGGLSQQALLAEISRLRDIVVLQDDIA